MICRRLPSSSQPLCSDSQVRLSTSLLARFAFCRHPSARRRYSLLLDIRAFWPPLVNGRLKRRHSRSQPVAYSDACHICLVHDAAESSNQVRVTGRTFLAPDCAPTLSRPKRLGFTKTSSMSASGQKRTLRRARAMSAALPQKAHIAERDRHVR